MTTTWNIKLIFILYIIKLWLYNFSISWGSTLLANFTCNAFISSSIFLFSWIYRIIIFLIPCNWIFIVIPLTQFTEKVTFNFRLICITLAAPMVHCNCHFKNPNTSIVMKCMTWTLFSTKAATIYRPLGSLKQLYVRNGRLRRKLKLYRNF